VEIKLPTQGKQKEMNLRKQLIQSPLAGLCARSQKYEVLILSASCISPGGFVALQATKTELPVFISNQIALLFLE